MLFVSILLIIFFLAWAVTWGLQQAGVLRQAWVVWVLFMGFVGCIALILAGKEHILG